MRNVEERNTKVGVFDPQLGMWLVDTCAGGTWDPDTDNALEYANEEEAIDALKAADMWQGGQIYVFAEIPRPERL